MISSAIIVFRETLEAALIIGIIAAATRGLPRGRWLSGGVLAGILGSLVVASFTGKIAEFAEGMGQEILNACILGIAVVMLAWHNIWMSRHGAELARSAKKLGNEVASGSRELSALALVVALAVLREGSETVLFLYGMIAGNENSVSSVLSGGGIGLAIGVLAGYALYAGVLRIPARWFFAATSAFILLLAAALASQMARFLVQADILPSLTTPIWDTSGVLANDSAIGILLHAVMGYDATPSGMQVVFYTAAFTCILCGMWLSRTAPYQPKKP